MMEDLGLEDLEDISTQDSGAETSSESIPADESPVNEQGALDSTKDEPTPDDASVDEPRDTPEPELLAQDSEEAADEPDEFVVIEEETDAAEIAEEQPAAAENADQDDSAEPEAERADLAEVAEGAADIAEDPAAAVESAYTEEEDGRGWFVVHCYSGYENKVRHNLEQRIETMGMKDRIFDVVVPTEEEIEVKDGKRKTIERRVFPGYILVQMIMTEESWYVVRNTPGVTGFVGMGNEPTALRPEEVSQIIKRMEAEAPRIKVTYKIGQKVRIIDGPFNDFIGTVDEIDMERAKVRVMVSFFGRETPVELDFLQVEKA